MDDNNNVVVVKDKIDTEPRTEQAKQIFSHSGGKARSRRYGKLSDFTERNLALHQGTIWT